MGTMREILGRKLTDEENAAQREILRRYWEPNEEVTITLWCDLITNRYIVQHSLYNEEFEFTELRYAESQFTGFVKAYLD
jgi:hypothetical protein